MQTALALVFCAGLCAAASLAQANDGFEDGSFGETSPQPPANEVQVDNGDDFGGSFGEGETNPPENGQETVVVTPPDPDDGFIDDGNIGEQGEEEPRREPEQVTPPEREIVVQPPEITPPRQKPEKPKQPETVKIDPGILAFETRDFGVPPTNRLRASGFHAPTPTSIPGGNLVTTAQLAGAIQGGQQLVIIDVLGSDYTLPNALSAPAMAQPGHYRDRVQQQTNHWLGQITGNNRQVAIVIACSDPFCWLSYNASLRAIAAGYTNVYWYRGGHQAWNMAGLPFASSGF
ncbi:MAG: rhodanese-like domain-containing protein [Pseudomonadota bacterium]